MKIDLEIIKNAVLPEITRLGYELVDVKFSIQYGIDTLSVFIFKKGDMQLSDCEAVHKAIDPVLDNLNPTGDKPYNLEVSSMGLDWNLKTDADFSRRIGEDLELSLYEKIDGAKKYTGILNSFNNDTVTLSITDGKGNDTGKCKIFERKKISKAIVAIRFD